MLIYFLFSIIFHLRIYAISYLFPSLILTRLFFLMFFISWCYFSLNTLHIFIQYLIYIHIQSCFYTCESFGMKNIHMLKKRNMPLCQKHKNIMDWRNGLLVKDFAAKPDNLDLVPGTHMVEEENWFLYVTLWPLQEWHQNCVHIHSHTQKFVKITLILFWTANECVYVTMPLTLLKCF